MNGDLGKILISMGLFLIVAGVLFSIFSKITGVPKLPGDVLIKNGNFTFYFPWVTSIVVSIILSLIFYLFFRK